MSNPTELPDLDRIANDLESEAIPYEGDFADAVRAAIEDIREIAAARRAQPEGFVSKSAYDAATSLAGEVIDARNAEISDLRAQLAQPEGEAPQAVLRAEHRATIEEAAQVLESAAAHNRKKGRTVLEREQQDRANRLRAILAAPAAQHAESSAPVYEVFDVNVGGWHKANKAVYELASLGFRRVVYGDMPAESDAPTGTVQEQFDQWQHARLFANPPQSVTPYDAYVAGLAAQSQGAQATLGGVSAAVEHLQTVVEETARTLRGYGRMAVADRLKDAVVMIERAALAAKAEAPVDPYALDDDDEVRFPNDTQVAIVSVKRYYELRGFEDRAQHAAAPGALDVEPPRMTAHESREYLVKFMERHFTDKTYHRYIRGERDSVNLATDFAWQMARALRMLEATSSAPGTPEALRYTCIGKGGEYELVGMVYGAGTSAGQIMTLYREVSTDVMYFRTPGDFNARMQRLDRAAQLDGGQGEGKAHG